MAWVKQRMSSYGEIANFRLVSFGEIKTKKQKEKHKTQDEDKIQDIEDITRDTHFKSD